MLDPIDIKFFKLAIGSGRIKSETPQDIAARCPICGDSKYSKNKARLHLYQKNDVTLVNCFNECSCQNINVYNFLKNYYPNLLESYKSEKFKDNLKSLTHLNDSDFLGSFKDFEIKEPKEEPKNDFEKPSVLFDLSNIFTKDKRIEDYLKGRSLNYSKKFGDFFIGKSLTIDGKNFPIDDYIVIPLYCENKWYGFYSRSLKEHKFFTYIPEKNSGFKLWNYYNIDKSKPVYVFEGIFDAMSAFQKGFTNVVACLGATPPLERLEGLDCIMCFDNDRTGKVNSIKFARKGFKVLCYPDDLKFKDFNEMFQNNFDIENLLKNNIKQSINAVVSIQRQL